MKRELSRLPRWQQRQFLQYQLTRLTPHMEAEYHPVKDVSTPDAKRIEWLLDLPWRDRMKVTAVKLSTYESYSMGLAWIKREIDALPPEKTIDKDPFASPPTFPLFDKMERLIAERREEQDLAWRLKGLDGTVPQKLLLLYYEGHLEEVISDGNSLKTKAETIGKKTGLNAQSIEKYLSVLLVGPNSGGRNSLKKRDPFTKSNLEWVCNNTLGIALQEAENQLNKITKK